MKLKYIVLIVGLLMVSNIACACKGWALICGSITDKWTCKNAHQYHKGKSYNCKWGLIHKGNASWDGCERGSKCGLTDEFDEYEEFYDEYDNML